MSSLERLRSSRVARTTLFVIASALLVVALVGVWNAFAEAAQEPPTVGYEHAGEFRWSAGVCPTVLYSEELPPEVVEPPEEPEPEEETLAGALMEAEGHVRRLGACADVLEQICNDTSDEFVNWVEVRVDDTYLHVSANRVPLNIAEAMRISLDELVGRKPTGPA